MNTTKAVIVGLCVQIIVISAHLHETHANDHHPGHERFIPNTFFGTTTHVNREDRGAMKLLKWLNIRTVRLDFPLRVLAAKDGGHHFSGNFIVESADLGARLGLDQMALIGRPPAWMAADHSRVFPNDQSVEAFEAFMFALASKYKGKVTNWEGPNEEHMPQWKERYAIMLRALHRGVKRADPQNRVVLGTFDTSEAHSLDAAYRYGIKDHFDVLNTHPYTWPRLPEEGGYVGKIEELRQVMNKHGDDKPIYVSEIGWNGVEPSMLAYLRSKYPMHKARSTSEEDQARALARLYLVSASIPSVERVYVFGLGHLSHGTVPYGSESESELDYLGLSGSWLGGVRPKPAFFSLRTVVRMISDTTYKGAIDMGSRIWALVFQRGSEATVALWSLDDGVTMVLEDASMIDGITSMVGTPMLVSDRLPLSGRPIYLHLPVVALDRVKEQTREARLPGSPLFGLTLGLDLQRSRADEAVVAVTVTNVGNQGRQHPDVHLNVGPSCWELNRDRMIDDQPLQAGQDRAFPVFVRGPAAKGAEIAFEVSARIFGRDWQSRAERTIRYVVAGARPQRFAADGKLDEWAGTTAIEIGKTARQRKLADWKGPQDCKVQWYCAYDRRAFYFAAAVEDNAHHQPHDDANADGMWGFDSIQLGLDVAGDATPVHNVLRYDGVNDYEIGLALGARGPIAYCWENPRGGPGILKFEAYEAVRDERAKVTNYEVAIPWTSLGLDGAPIGCWMGMNVVVNDSDGEGRKGWVEWAPGIGAMKDPSQFPKVLIGGN